LPGADAERIVESARMMRQRGGGWPNPFGDGRAGERIVDVLLGG